jgi:hypothetical protein
VIAESECTISAPDRNVPVIPLLLDEATMARADELPPSLVWLVRRQAPRTRPSPASTMTPSRLSKSWTQLLPKSRPAEPTCRAGGLSGWRERKPRVDLWCDLPVVSPNGVLASSLRCPEA